MQRSKLFLLISGAAAILLSLGLFILSLQPGWQGKADSAIVFLTLAATFAILIYFFPDEWRWKYWLFAPASLFLAMGLVFLMNAITNDWGAWAYAWMFCISGLAAGLALGSRFSGHLQNLMPWAARAAGIFLGFFAFFGAIVGGVFMRGFSLLLLAAGGVLLILRARHPRIARGADPSPANPSPQLARPNPETEPLVEPLTGRELEVLHLIEQGLTNQQIAERMVVAASTVKTHINNIYAKLGVQTRTQAVRRGRELGLM
jgi:DNA-binding CsgD family transcriptional regulator